MAEPEDSEKIDLCPVCKEKNTFEYTPHGDAIYNYAYCKNCGTMSYMGKSRNNYFGENENFKKTKTEIFIELLKDPEVREMIKNADKAGGHLFNED